MKVLLIGMGFLSLGLGILGIFLPVLPTTPFVLLSAYLFGKSSHRFHQYLSHHRLFGPIIRDYQEKKALKRKTKVISLIIMWIVLLTSVIFFTPFLWAKVIVLLICAGTSTYLILFHEYKE